MICMTFLASNDRFTHTERESIQNESIWIDDEIDEKNHQIMMHQKNKQTKQWKSHNQQQQQKYLWIENQK